MMLCVISSTKSFVHCPPFPGSPQAQEECTEEDSFTYFQMRDGQYQGHITNTEGTIGLYVDTDDGWRVKATSDNSLWDKFAIKGFIGP